MPAFTRSRSAFGSGVSTSGIFESHEITVATLPTPTMTPLDKMTVSELKLQLKELSLPVSGVKRDLVMRLENHKSWPNPQIQFEPSSPKKSKYFSSETSDASFPSDPTNEDYTKFISNDKESENFVFSTPTKSKISTSKSLTLENDDAITSDSKSFVKTSKKSTSPSKRTKIEPGSLKPPQNWERIYSLVLELRSDRSAPVDIAGGHEVPERHLGETVYRFQVLITLMLSSQTKDAVVAETIKILQKHGLTVENIHKTTHEKLNALIGKVGFHNNKTKYIKQSAEIIINQYNGDIPSTAQELMTLPGVGPKMAYIVENVAFGCPPSGIGVDTHMHRMFNDLKWVNSTNPEGTREQLEGWLPREKWGEINVLWVGFGQEVQQQKEKSLRKALSCSSPREALKLIQKLRLDLKKEGRRFGLEDEIKKALMINDVSPSEHERKEHSTP